ncbi:MAG: DUF1828 domain-containing protein [Anaerolineae bacterium]|nr:DUF1828 domain-containing protein [Anaerolineae bacterium]
MNLHGFSESIQSAIGRQVVVESEGQQRFVVTTPFIRDDGDHFNIVLKASDDQTSWVVSDEGETFMHLSYWTDVGVLQEGVRQKITEQVLRQSGVENREGELRMEATYADLGNAVFTFLQTLTRVNDISYLSRESLRSTFLDDFRVFLRSVVPSQRLVFDYHHPKFDRHGAYAVDALIRRPDLPLFVFAIDGDDRCRDVTINLHMYQQWSIKFQSIAIFEDQQSIARDVLARFTDVADKQFSSLTSNEARIEHYLKQWLAEAG